MNISKRLVLGGAAAALVIAGGTGTAFAASHSSAPAAAGHVSVTEPTGPDTDSLQQGDQTTPDAPALSKVSSESAVAPKAAAPKAAEAEDPAGAPDTDNIQSGDQSGDQTGPEDPASGPDTDTDTDTDTVQH
jgi:hypothetical protein